MINNLGTSSSKLQVNSGVLQIDTENSATGIKKCRKWNKVSCSYSQKSEIYFIYPNTFLVQFYLKKKHMRYCTHNSLISSWNFASLFLRGGGEAEPLSDSDDSSSFIVHQKSLNSLESETLFSHKALLEPRFNLSHIVFLDPLTPLIILSSLLKSSFFNVPILLHIFSSFDYF